MKKITFLLMGALVLMTTGCLMTSAGPFVTNVSDDGKGNLIIEKCMIAHDGFNATISNDSCNSSTILNRK